MIFSTISYKIFGLLIFYKFKLLPYILVLFSKVILRYSSFTFVINFAFSSVKNI
ncbi:hypothetical protein HMPREF9073_03152 [Capnocytophaga sp. oral taxon 326 str. F0382]|nr:hypothetical protein HMPREF9073_03152 [Capnocytophaga sp. oral taxon 326 str. F0382]